MSNLWATLGTASRALQVFDRSLTVEQNNTNNASTPGFARQDSVLLSLPFQPADNLVGGVKAGTPFDSRDTYGERSVWDRSSASGYYGALADKLGPLQSLFDVSGKTGIPASLSKLTQAFSAWSTSPQSADARQAVIAAAQDVAGSFNQAASQVAGIRVTTDRDLSATTDQINSLAARIQAYNVARLKSPTPDAGAEAGLYDALESLSKQVDFQAIQQSDGTFTVLLGGQQPLVIGQDLNAIHLDYTPAPGGTNPAGPPPARVLSANGTDITSQITGGKLAGLLSIRNRELPSIEGDPNQAGSLNELARGLADRVNQLLASGTDGQNPPQQGAPLFQYSQGSTSVAASLAVPASLAPAQLAAADPGPPFVSNGVAQHLANLLQSNNPADQISGQSVLNFFGSIAAQAGQQSAAATSSKDQAASLLAQAKSLRDATSGVSLDEEATRLLALQRAYQAAARVVTIVDNLAETAVNLIR